MGVIVEQEFNISRADHEFLDSTYKPITNLEQITDNQLLVLDKSFFKRSCSFIKELTQKIQQKPTTKTQDDEAYLRKYNLHKEALSKDLEL
jgi:hypothetical protein